MSNIRSETHVPSRKQPFHLSRSVSQTVVETEVDEKWAITEGFNSGSVITLQISDFPSFISTLFIAAAFLSENKMISLRQYNARNNRFGQTFAEAWWAWLTITEFHCGFTPLFFPLVHLFICYSKWQWVLPGGGVGWWGWWVRSDGSTKKLVWTEKKSFFITATGGPRWLFNVEGASERKHTPSCLGIRRWQQGSDLPPRAPVCLRCNCRTSRANTIFKTCGFECECVYM